MYECFPDKDAAVAAATVMARGLGYAVSVVHDTEATQHKIIPYNARLMRGEHLVATIDQRGKRPYEQ